MYALTEMHGRPHPCKGFNVTMQMPILLKPSSIRGSKVLSSIRGSKERKAAAVLSAASCRTSRVSLGRVVVKACVEANIVTDKRISRRKGGGLYLWWKQQACAAGFQAVALTYGLAVDANKEVSA